MYPRHPHFTHPIVEIKSCISFYYKIALICIYLYVYICLQMMSLSLLARIIIAGAAFIFLWMKQENLGKNATCYLKLRRPECYIIGSFWKC